MRECSWCGGGVEGEANRLAVFLRDPEERSRSRALIDAIRAVRDR
jgi:hypothetical protein